MREIARENRVAGQRSLWEKGWGMAHADPYFGIAFSVVVPD